MKKDNIKKISVCAIFTAVICASAWISIPTPFGINLTMQLFAVCITAFCLGAKWGIAAVVAYIAIGAVGLPVFSSFSGGIGILFGASGGFLWGFLAVALICGVTFYLKNKAIKYLLYIFAVIFCHFLGALQYSLISGIGFFAAVITASLPFLIKDIILVFFADITAKKLNKILRG